MLVNVKNYCKEIKLGLNNMLNKIFKMFDYSTCCNLTRLILILPSNSPNICFDVRCVFGSGIFYELAFGKENYR